LNTPASGSPSTPNAPFSKDLTITVSVVICTLSRPDTLRNCLAAIARLDPAPNEVLVVDNSPGHEATKALAGSFGARYTTEPLIGLSRARNRGLAESNSEIVAFLDDDAVPDVHWLRRILEPFSDARVASVTGETISPGHPIELAFLEPPRRLSCKDPLWFEIATFGGLGFGTNMALRKSTCEGREFFDVRLGRGAPFWIAEESQAFASLIARGHLAVHVPAAVVIHPVKPRDVEREATTSFAYWLLLFFEFPGHKLDLLRFLLRRLRRKRLLWPRDPQGPGEVITSGWRIYLKAGFKGAGIYFHNRKPPG
jgi:glycosyltransferase involved in cell wall biosynthesis